MKSNEEKIIIELRMIKFVLFAIVTLLVFIAALLSLLTGILTPKALGIALICIAILSLLALPLLAIARKA